MLKIKDKVDLKWLEKFGFKEINYVNVKIYMYENDFCNIIIGEDKIIHFNHFTVNNTAGLNIVYDLIKADLVEKVDDNYVCSYGLPL